MPELVAVRLPVAACEQIPFLAAQSVSGGDRVLVSAPESRPSSSAGALRSALVAVAVRDGVVRSGCGRRRAALAVCWRWRSCDRAAPTQDLDAVEVGRRHRLRHVDDGDAASGAARPYPVIVLDVDLPGLDGAVGCLAATHLARVIVERHLAARAGRRRAPARWRRGGSPWGCPDGRRRRPRSGRRRWAASPPQPMSR